MSRRLPQATRAGRLLLLALMAAAWAGCATVRLVGDYDAYVDQTATRLQKDMDTFLTRLENLPAASPERKFAPNLDFYMNYGVELRSLGTRVAATPRNQTSQQQLQLMESSLDQLRAAHQEQDFLSTAALGQYRILFNTAWTAVLAWELAKRR